jgi:hypothetical protein
MHRWPIPRSALCLPVLLAVGCASPSPDAPPPPRASVVDLDTVAIEPGDPQAPRCTDPSTTSDADGAGHHEGTVLPCGPEVTPATLFVAGPPVDRIAPPDADAVP